MHSLLAFLYCNCVLRQASLLFAVWSAKGWGPLAFTTMLQPGPRPYLPPTLSADADWLNLERLTIITGIARSTISGVLTQLHGPWLLHLGQRERIAVLEATASLYASLGYRRKEAYLLREVLGCLLDLMVCGREEDGFSQTPNIPQSAGLGIHNVHPVAGANWGAVGVRLSESTAGNESILKLLAHVCRVLGINLQAVGLSESTDTKVVDQPPSLNNYDEDIVDELREPCGWPELQVGVVREAVAVAEALPGMSLVRKAYFRSSKSLRFSYRCSICFVFAQNATNRPFFWRPISSIFHCNKSSDDCSPERRPESCRILVWQTNCQHLRGTVRHHAEYFEFD